MVKFWEFDGGTDQRGWSFALDAKLFDVLSSAKNMHFASIRPFAVRGNHYHLIRNEIIVILPGAPWEMYWDQGEGTTVNRRLFGGATGVGIEVPQRWSHAIRNPGKAELYIVAISDHHYTSEDPDTYSRKVSPT